MRHPPPLPSLFTSRRPCLGMPPHGIRLQHVGLGDTDVPCTGWAGTSGSQGCHLPVLLSADPLSSLGIPGRRQPQVGPTPALVSFLLLGLWF